jgi:hypothetical protein
MLRLYFGGATVSHITYVRRGWISMHCFFFQSPFGFKFCPSSARKIRDFVLFNDCSSSKSYRCDRCPTGTNVICRAVYVFETKIGFLNHYNFFLHNKILIARNMDVLTYLLPHNGWRDWLTKVLLLSKLSWCSCVYICLFDLIFTLAYFITDLWAVV